MKRDRATNIPFSWYWQGRPLRGNQIRPVYTGTHHAYAPNPREYPCCVDPVPLTSHPAPDSNSNNNSHLSNHRSSKTKSSKRQQLHTPEPDCHTPDTCCEPAPAPAPASASGADAMKPEPCFCSLCQSENEHHETTSYSSSTCGGAAAAGTSVTSPSIIHYHAHAYLDYCPVSGPYYEYPSSNTQPPCPNPASCSACSPYLYQGYCFYPTNKHGYCYGYGYEYEYPCSSPSSSQPHCEECFRGEFQRHCRHCEDKDTGDDDASSVSSYTVSEYSDCGSHVDGEESCECCAPAWKYYDHPTYQVKRV